MAAGVKGRRGSVMSDSTVCVFYFLVTLFCNMLCVSLIHVLKLILLPIVIRALHILQLIFFYAHHCMHTLTLHLLRRVLYHIFLCYRNHQCVIYRCHVQRKECVIEWCPLLQDHNYFLLEGVLRCSQEGNQNILVAAGHQGLHQEEFAEMFRVEYLLHTHFLPNFCFSSTVS